MKTFVGFISTLIMSGGLGLLVYITFRSGRPVGSSLHVATKRAPGAADENGEGGVSGPERPAQVKLTGRADEDQVSD
jgi:hypothetical protein